MKNMIYFFLIVGTRAALGVPTSFPAVWDQIQSQSAAIDASRLQEKAIGEAKDRASRHWLPQIYLDVKSYQTNQPGASFFGILEQGSVRQSDFNPDNLNHPESRTYSKGVLGLNLAIYEGGMRTALSNTQTRALNSQEKTTRQVQLDLYSMVSSSYASIAIIEQQKSKLLELSSEIEKFLKNYQLGNKSNPVGYSGLLGMKSLQNRLTGLLKQYEAQVNSYYASLKELGLNKSDWTPVIKDTLYFVDRYLTPTNEEIDLSFKIQAIQENVKASEEMIKMERARFLPRVGAFIENETFTGNRDTANGYMAGVYLQWNLFNPSDFGTAKETRLKALSANQFLLASEQQERSERRALFESVKALRENINLLNNSYKILSEQSSVAATLFRNGSINALQIVEILNRRTDLIVDQMNTEMGLVKAASQLVTKGNFDLQKHLIAEKKD